MENKYQIALIGLGVMGQSLARNIASHKFPILVYNRHTERAKEYIGKYGNAHLDYRKDLKSLCRDLKRPRKLILMIKDGAPVDEMIAKLRPYLQKGDIVIDAGNSFYKDSIRRTAELKKKGLIFVGMGVSGGEEGALRGPSIMPGGEATAWKELSPILKAIAAKDFSGKPCVTHVGADGAGHFVKMVHNGIEYAVMQMMAEVYNVFRKNCGLNAHEISEIFVGYNGGKLKSFLFEIAVPVLSRRDEFKKGFLVDFILDRAGQKGTGMWTARDALERGAVAGSLIMAVQARSASSFKNDRVTLSKLYKKPAGKETLPLADLIILYEEVLYAGMISAYAQGFELIRIAAAEQGWKINFAEVARIWEGGCIIRAELLNFIHKAFMSAKGKPVHLFGIKEVQKALMQSLSFWRKGVAYATVNGIPMPAAATALTYFESMTSENLPANFIQGLRDFFGAHTYERTDRPGSFHTPWSDLT